MKKLFRFEFRKLFRQTSFYTCLLTAALLAFLTVYTLVVMLRLLQRDIPPGVDPAPWTLGWNLSGKSQMLTALSGENTTLVLGIFTALLICPDFSKGTAKNIIGRGYSRCKWHSAKLTVLCCACLILCAATLLTAFVSGTLFWEAGGALSTREMGRLLLQMAVMLAYAAVFAFVSVLIRSSAGAIAVNVLIPVFLSLLLTILDLALFEGKDTTVKYWLSSALSTASDPNASGGELLRSWLLAGGYGAVFTALSYRIVSRRDL